MGFACRCTEGKKSRRMPGLPQNSHCIYLMCGRVGNTPQRRAGHGRAGGPHRSEHSGPSGRSARGPRRSRAFPEPKPSFPPAPSPQAPQKALRCMGPGALVLEGGPCSRSPAPSWKRLRLKKINETTNTHTRHTLRTPHTCIRGVLHADSTRLTHCCCHGRMPGRCESTG